MTVIVQAVWATAPEGAKEELIRYAREGERLIAAIGALRNMPAVIAPSASTLTVQSTAAAVDEWANAYTARWETVGGMPLAVLWYGITPVDLRALDSILHQLLSITEHPPAWTTIVQTLRDKRAPQAIMAEADWWQSAGAVLSHGQQNEQYRDGAHRQWWAGFANWLPIGATPAGPGTGGNTNQGNTNQAGGLFGLSEEALGMIAALGLLLLKRRRR